MATPKVTKKKTVRKKNPTYKAKRTFISDRGSTTSSATGKKVRKNKKSAAIKNKGASNTSWYCPACKKNVELSMRMCKNRNVWYHEVCMGLDSDDKADFFVLIVNKLQCMDNILANIVVV